MSVSIIESVTSKYVQSTKADYWKGSRFEEIVKLTNDERGRWGEELLYSLIKNYTNLNVFWDADTNIDPEDGTYDLWFEKIIQEVLIKIRNEVKTSGRTISKGRPIGWQHENIYYTDKKWDKLTFIDYDANDVIYITIVDYDQIVKNDVLDLSIFGKNGHQRKNEEGKAKVDFSMKSIRAGIDAGVTFEYNLSNPSNEDFASFLINRLA